MEKFVDHYIESLLFYGAEEGLEMNACELSEEASRIISRECAQFYFANERLIREALEHYSLEDVAHDFYLTRCGHGAGFWDGDIPEELGEKLTKAAEEFGEQTPYYDDAGEKIYVCG